MKLCGALLLLPFVVAGAHARDEHAAQASQAPATDGIALLKQTLASQGVWFEPEIQACAIPARVLVRNDALEYVLVHRSGNSHESLFATETEAGQLNVALLALGVQPGKNAVWKAREPAPTREEMLAGAQPYDVTSPEGDGFLLYVAWKEQDETFFFRLEDLIRNLQSGRSMRRHAWVYLGSRSVPSREDPAKQLFLAELEGNLINLCFFEAGSTLLTGALPECLQQTIWIPNSSLLPPSGEPVLFVFSRVKLEACPAALRARVPELSPQSAVPDER